MELKLIDHNVNAIAFEKDGRRYGMCCAWCTQVAPDRLICAIGPQSATGRAIAKGNTVGFSNLAKDQQGVAFQLGDLERHSDSADKTAGLDVRTDGGAIFVNGARAAAKCTVLDVLHLDGIEAENIVYLKIEDGTAADGAALVISDLGLGA